MISLLGNETSANQLYTGLQAMLADVVPDFELRLKADLAAEINQLKVERNAVILGHNYMEPALFNSVPDFVGDSLELARKAAQTDKDIIVFCGVKFMAETAKILNPGKTVLLPSEKAGRLSRMPAARQGDATNASARIIRGSIEHFRIARVISRDGYASRSDL